MFAHINHKLGLSLLVTVWTSTELVGLVKQNAITI